MTTTQSAGFHLIKLALAISVAIGVSACDTGSSSSASSGVPYTGTITPTEEFEIPNAEPDGNGGYRIAPAKDGSFPAVPAAKVLHSGETYGLEEALQPAKLELGDLVGIRWKMYGLRSGELVEDSDDLFDGSAVNIILGGGKGGDADVPQAMHEALKGQRVGDRVQVVFQHEMPELPEFLNSDDAYTLIVDVIEKS